MIYLRTSWIGNGFFFRMKRTGMCPNFERKLSESIATVNKIISAVMNRLPGLERRYQLFAV